MKCDAERDGERAPKHPRQIQRVPCLSPSAMCGSIPTGIFPHTWTPGTGGRSKSDPRSTGVHQTRLHSSRHHVARYMPYTLYPVFGQTLPSLDDLLASNSCLLTHAERFPRGRVPMQFLIFFVRTTDGAEARLEQGPRST